MIPTPSPRQIRAAGFSRRSLLRAGLVGAAGLIGGPSLFAACSSSGDGAAGGSAGGGAGKELEFIWPGTSDVERAVAKEFNDSWGQARSGSSIKYDFLSWNDMNTQLATRIRAKNPPDATMLQDVTQFVQLNGLVDLTDRAAKAKIDLQSAEYLPGVVDYGKIDGKLYSLPYLAGAFTLLVNVDMLKAAGMNLDDLQSWSDIEAAAKAMTKGDVYGISYPLGNPRFAFRQPLTIGYSNGLKLNDTSAGAQQKWAELLDHIKKLQPYSPKAQATWDYPDMWRAYATGKVGMAVGGTYFTANVYSINTAIVGQTRQIAYPAGPSAGGAGKVPVTSVGYGLFNGAQNEDTAWEAIHELAGDKWTTRMAAAVNIPAKTSITPAQLGEIAKTVYPKATKAHEQITADGLEVVQKHGEQLIKIKGQVQMEQAIQPLMLNLVQGADTAKTQQDIFAALDKIAQQYK